MRRRRPGRGRPRPAPDHRSGRGQGRGAHQGQEAQPRPARHSRGRARRPGRRPGHGDLRRGARAGQGAHRHAPGIHHLPPRGAALPSRRGSERRGRGPAGVDGVPGLAGGLVPAGGGPRDQAARAHPPARRRLVLQRHRVPRGPRRPAAPGQGGPRQPHAARQPPGHPPRGGGSRGDLPGDGAAHARRLRGIPARPPAPVFRNRTHRRGHGRPARDPAGLGRAPRFAGLFERPRRLSHARAGHPGRRRPRPGGDAGGRPGGPARRALGLARDELAALRPRAAARGGLRAAAQVPPHLLDPGLGGGFHRGSPRCGQDGGNQRGAAGHAPGLGHGRPQRPRRRQHSGPAPQPHRGHARTTDPAARPGRGRGRGLLPRRGRGGRRGGRGPGPSSRTRAWTSCTRP